MGTPDYKAFFQKTGKVLSAIAMADNQLQPEEYQMLEALTLQQWDLTINDTNNNECLKHISQMKNAFDHLIKYPHTAEDILEEYQEFKQQHPELFTPKLKAFVYKTAHSIAASFADKNKSELVLLAKLHFVLKKE